jgi:hypothetical protein
MVRKTVVFAGLFLASLAFVLDTTATTAEACGRCGCRGCGGCGYGGCGYGGCGYGGCGYGYGGYYGVSSYGGCCGYGCGGPACGTACCATPVTIVPTCYTYPGSISYAGAPRQQYYVSPALPVSTYGLPVQMPLGSILRTSPPLMASDAR